MLTEPEHIEVIEYAKKLALTNDVLVSHYPHKLYNEMLAGWWYIDFKSQTRKGQVTERLWMNYNPAAITELQDTRYVGKNRIDRQRIKRKIGRMTKNIKRLPPLERQAFFRELAVVIPDAKL